MIEIWKKILINNNIDIDEINNCDIEDDHESEEMFDEDYSEDDGDDEVMMKKINHKRKTYGKEVDELMNKFEKSTKEYIKNEKHIDLTDENIKNFKINQGANTLIHLIKNKNHWDRKEGYKFGYAKNVTTNRVEATIGLIKKLCNHQKLYLCECINTINSTARLLNNRSFQCELNSEKIIDKTKCERGEISERCKFILNKQFEMASGKKRMKKTNCSSCELRNLGFEAYPCWHIMRPLVREKKIACSITQIPERGFKSVRTKQLFQSDTSILLNVSKEINWNEMKLFNGILYRPKEHENNVRSSTLVNGKKKRPKKWDEVTGLELKK